MPLERESRIVFQAQQGSPLGRITLAGLLRDHTGVPQKPLRILGSYALVYLLRGSGSYKDVNRTRRKLIPGDLLFIFPETPHWYGPPKGSVWDEFYIVFSGEMFDLWRKPGLLSPTNPVAHLEPVDYWLGRLQEVVVGQHHSLQQVCALQHVLAEAVETANPSPEAEWLERARKLLDKVDGCSPGQLEQTLGMAYETFRKKFTAQTGVSPTRYHQARLIDRACALMMGGQTSNKQIAAQLGFCDEFHFSKRFKQVMGVSPLDFRHRLPRVG